MNRVVALACWFCALAAEPPVQVNAAVDHAVVSPGETLRYTIELERSLEGQLELEEPGPQMGGLAVEQSGQDPERTVGGKVRERRWYVLRAATAGSYAIAGPKAGYRTSATDPLLPLQVPEVLVQVQADPAAAEELADIKPLHEVHYLSRWWLYGAAALGVAALGVAVWMWLRRRRKARVLPDLPPHEVAFIALNRLRRTNFADAEALRRYYFALSEVLRTYVEGRFHLNATDLTREEIMARLPELVALHPVEAELLREFLTDTDRVKYAGDRPDGAKIAQTYELALSFVEATRDNAPPTAPPAV